MKKVFILSALLVAIVCLPAIATTYQMNWTENFEGYNQADLTGQGGWLAVDGAYADTDTVVSTAQNHTSGGSKSSMQLVSTSLYSSNARDMRHNNQQNVLTAYKEGYAKFWVYEPGTAVAAVNYRVGVYGEQGLNQPTAGVAGGMFTANMAQATAGFWRAQWASDVRTIDGTTGITNSNYKWTPYRTAPRRATAGWSYVILTWGFDYSLGTGFCEWRINSASAAIRCDFDSTAAAGGNRWASIHSVSGVFIGDATVKVQTAGYQGYADDIEFHANPIPEPTSLLALGTGLVGLMGLIRRKR